MSIVQEIHNDFDLAVYDLIQMVNQESFLDWVKPTQINGSEYSELINYYRFRYPQQKFISEKQVKDICRKYNLVMGEDFLFAEEIPRNHKYDIDRFKLAKKDEILPKDENKNFDAYDYLIQNVSGDLEIQRHGSTRLAFAYEVMEDTSKGQKIVVSLGGEFALIIKLNRYEEYHAVSNNDYGCLTALCCEEDEVVTIEYRTEPRFSTTLVHQAKVGDSYIFDQVKISEDLRVQIDQENVIDHRGLFGGMQRIARQRIERRVSLDFELILKAMNKLGNKPNLDLTNTSLKVVAPANKFHNTDSFVLDEGYRMIINPNPRRAMRSPFIPDPIVLQPVKGGYLILAMWGDEAEIKEIQNGVNN